MSERDRLFRLVHVTVMAEVIFGDGPKSPALVQQTQARFSGEPPIAPFSTSQGMRLVEETLIQVAEGLAF